MTFYVCNSPEPMDVPWGVGIKMYLTEAMAIDAAKVEAEDDPGVDYYVHSFTTSTVFFRVKGRIETEAEYL